MLKQYPEIIVIVGSGRSGTTYLARMLKQSMDIGFSGEPKFIVPMYHRLHNIGSLHRPENMRRLVKKIHDGKMFQHLHQVVGVPSFPEEILDRVREPTYSSVLYATFKLMAEKRGHSRLGYKDPGNVAHLPLISKLLPTARFIHIIRDGRDVSLSLIKFRWGATNVYCGGRDWAQRVLVGRRDGTSLGGRYFELRFEDLILNTEKVATELGNFVNQGRSPEQVQNLVERINRTKEPSSVQVWRSKMDSAQQFLCEAAAGDELRACGYPTKFEIGLRLHPLKAAWYLGKDFVVRARNHLSREFKLG